MHSLTPHLRLSWAKHLYLYLGQAMRNGRRAIRGALRREVDNYVPEFILSSTIGAVATV